jgi:hypothetical protein
MFRIDIIQVEMFGFCCCGRCECNVGFGLHCFGSRMFAQKVTKVWTTKRPCDEVWYFSCNVHSSVVRLVGQWR